MKRFFLAVAISAVCNALAAQSARACTQSSPCQFVVAPKSGTTGVPLNAGLAIGRYWSELELSQDSTVIWSAAWLSACLTSVPLPKLEPAKEYVLTGKSPAGSLEELTRFTTSLDRTEARAGTPPAVTALIAKQMEYPLEYIEHSSCEWCTTADLAFVEFGPALFPDTPAASVLYAWRIVSPGAAVQPAEAFADAVPGATSLGCEGPFPCNAVVPCATRSVGSQVCARVVAWGIPYSPGDGLVGEEICTHVVRETVPGLGGSDAGSTSARPFSCSTAGSGVLSLAGLVGLVALRRRARRPFARTSTTRGMGDEGSSP